MTRRSTPQHTKTSRTTAPTGRQPARNTMWGPVGSRIGHRRGLQLAVWLAGVAVACGVEPQPTPPPAAVPSTVQAEATAMRVDIDIHAEGLRARFTLDAPTTRLVFAATQTIRRDAWAMQTPGITLADNEVTGQEPFTKFELLLRPDPQQHDRVYPSVTRVGEGLVINGTSLLLDGLDVNVEMDPGPEGIVWPPSDATKGYTYIGPSKHAAESDGLRLVGVDTLAPWLATAIEIEVKATFPLYTRLLGRSVQTPAIFATRQTPGPASFHGDVTDNAVIFLRFHGAHLDTPDHGAEKRVAKFVRHEAFHMWNARNGPETPPWLHEGGAEYAAIVVAVHAGVLTQAEGVERLSHHLTRCQRELGDRPMVELPRAGSAVYDCGVAMQWFADLELRKRGDDIFSLWTHLLERADASDGYTVADFRERTGPLVALALDAPGGERWSSLEQAIPDYGAAISGAPSEADLRSATMTHLLRQACGDGPRGYWTEEPIVRLDTGDGCGPLAGNPEIVAVQGHPLWTEAEAAFEAVGARCAASEAITLQRRNGPTIEIACSEQPTRPVVFAVEAAPTLSVSK